MKLSHALLIAGLVCGLFAIPVQAGAGSAEIRRQSLYAGADSQIVIKRAPNFGNQSNISLFIDGTRVSTLGYGRSYTGTLSAGRHLVTMMQTPHLNDAYPYSQHWIRLVPGQTSVYTAIWRNGGTRIALE
ncbi:MAG: hypothetical protein ABI787_08110 [Spartobacteria bacterium]